MTCSDNSTLCAPIIVLPRKKEHLICRTPFSGCFFNVGMKQGRGGMRGGMRGDFEIYGGTSETQRNHDYALFHHNFIIAVKLNIKSN